MVKPKFGGYIAVSQEDKNKVSEAFIGEVSVQEEKFPKGLGEKHPFDFESIENLVKRYGIALAILCKTTDEIVTDFEIKLQNPNAQELINSFTRNTTLHQVVWSWVFEALGKGSGFMEIDLKDYKTQVLNANYMYVKRNSNNKILKYIQWKKPFSMFSRGMLNDTNTFNPNQIAHLTINQIPGEAYGIGIIWPNERVIENLVTNEQDLQLINSRKAGAPYHIKVGQPGSNTPAAVVDAVKANLQYLRNTVEWVTDGDTEIKSIDFAGLGKSLTEAQMYFYRQLLGGTEMPEVLMGSGQLNEGIAKVQLEGRKRKIMSLQTQVANILEEKVIKPLLLANGFDESPEFVWELPTEESINERLDRLQLLISSAMISPTLKAAAEIEMAKLLGFEDIVDYMISPKDAEEEYQAQLEKQKEEQIPQPEVPGVKPNAKASQESKKEIQELIKKVGDEYCVFSHQTGKKFGCYKTKAEAEKRLAQIKKFSKSNKLEIKETKDYTVKEWVNIQELAGFNYTDYLIHILDVLKTDKFANLKAITEADIANGLLPETEVEKLRLVLKNGFRSNQTITQIEGEIKSKVDLKDRIAENGAIINKETRANNIARTETVRLANKGLLNLYNKNNIEKVRFLAALSDRTCDQCEALNGQVFNLNESYDIIPVHTACRCSWISVTE